MNTEKLVGILADRIMALEERITVLEALGPIFSAKWLVPTSRSPLDHPNRRKELDRHPELVVKRTEDIT